MSGFLRSISAQALGLGKVVRSTARLPYAAMPAILADGTGDELPAVRPPASAGDSGQLPARDQPVPGESGPARDRSSHSSFAWENRPSGERHREFVVRDAVSEVIS